MFPSPAGMSLTKLSLGGNNLYMTSLFPPNESLVNDMPGGDGNIEKLFLRCIVCSHPNLCNVCSLYFSVLLSRLNFLVATNMPSVYRYLYHVNNIVQREKRRVESGIIRLVDRSWEYMNRSQTHDCGNWD